MTRRIDIQAILADPEQKRKLLQGFAEFLIGIKDDMPHQIRSQRPTAAHTDDAEAKQGQGIKSTPDGLGGRYGDHHQKENDQEKDD